MSAKSLKGQRAMVTGASSGIGRETARMLAEEGADVALAARSEDELEAMATSIEAENNVDALVVPTDVTDEEQVSQMIESTVAAFGGLDIVVNNAGVGRRGPIEEMSTEDYRAVMGVNVDGMFFVTREAVPHLLQSEGTLVFVGSGAGKGPRSKYPVYAASKWWTRGFAQSVAGQVGGDDVAVSVVNPGNTRTGFGSEYRESNREQHGVGDALEPADIADAIVFTASQDSPSVVSELDVKMR